MPMLHIAWFFGDEVSGASVRSQHQRISAPSHRPSAAVRAAPSEGVAERGHLCDYLAPGSWVVLLEPEELNEQGKVYLERVEDRHGLFSLEGVFAQLLRFPSVHVSAMRESVVRGGDVSPPRRVGGALQRRGRPGCDDLDQVAQAGGPTPDFVLIACENEAECKRLTEVLAAGQLAQTDRLRLVTGRVRAGFRLVDPAGSVVVLGGQELFHRDDVRTVVPRRRLESRAIDSFLDLAEGDLVVHVSHGIARYRGMQMLTKNRPARGAPRAGVQ
jgi:transcription-repair coupling factor (superfamily II helicase)